MFVLNNDLAQRDHPCSSLLLEMLGGPSGFCSPCTAFVPKPPTWPPVYPRLTFDFLTNKRIIDELAIVPPKRLHIKILGFTAHLMNSIQHGPVRGISKLQEEERERTDNYVPEVSALDTSAAGLEVGGASCTNLTKSIHQPPCSRSLSAASAASTGLSPELAGHEWLAVVGSLLPSRDFARPTHDAHG
ncbi:ribosomal S17-domain-containing protein [Pholiota molesta]|nr:ribosomal S17-domain-containing protein [Pholiota molesta]